MASNGSGDIFVAFSTANNAELRSGSEISVDMLGNEHINPVLVGTVEATEEAIVNAMVVAKDMTGNEGHMMKAIDHRMLQTVLRKYNRLEESR